MASPLKWMHYIRHKIDHSIVHGILKYYIGHTQMTGKELRDFMWKNFLMERLTYLHWYKGGEHMAPTIAGNGETLLVRKLPFAHPTTIAIGDVVVLKDPEEADNYLVRRVTGLEGYEMVSTDDKDEPFVLEKGQCWVVADNKKLKAKEAKDSRSFGPVDTDEIVGRVLYYLRTPVDHGRVSNSKSSMKKDSSVLAVELDIDELSKSHKA